MLTRIKTLAVAAAFTALSAVDSNVIAATPASGNTAPEFTGIDTWLNSEPLTMQRLRGKVVLIDFWTYSCINCIHTLPYVKSWYEKYRNQGLVVVGVHTPEYPIERDTDNVRTAISRFGIRYPVAQDNQYATWNAYGNQYWPAFYLIDRHGRVVYSRVGEGGYAQTEATIQRLLAEKN
ncbi:Redoxin domain protein [Burkholderia sp. lig30]|jgi:thiol-disulfide isomerase/thioredoxin|uniref:thioredoxin family protein n=1 Tax=Burkholderia sp. lig30 TaxID=1192124 RepID=UPI000461FD43|nr:thioredoxin family protein [Burkholderia sp. lig30]KDB06680.1 Redoxin domain protein [Burkholderia sp. lig30]